MRRFLPEKFYSEVVGTIYMRRSLEKGQLFPLSFPFLLHGYFSFSFSQTFTCSSDIRLCAFVSCVVILSLPIYLCSIFGREIVEMTVFFKTSSKFFSSLLQVLTKDGKRLFFSTFLLVELPFIFIIPSIIPISLICFLSSCLSVLIEFHIFLLFIMAMDLGSHFWFCHECLCPI